MTELAILPPRSLRRACVGAAFCIAGVMSFAGFVAFDKGNVDRGLPFSLRDGGESLLVPADLGDLVQRDRALRALRLDPVARTRLLAALQEDDGVGLGWIAVVDTMDPDGDTIRISGLGFHQDVVATATPQILAVPFRRGGDVEVTGLRDGGGGGITVAVMTAQGPLPLKFLLPGETIRIRAP